MRIFKLLEKFFQNYSLKKSPNYQDIDSSWGGGWRRGDMTEVSTTTKRLISELQVIF